MIAGASAGGALLAAVLGLVPIATDPTNEALERARELIAAEQVAEARAVLEPLAEREPAPAEAVLPRRRRPPRARRRRGGGRGARARTRFGDSEKDFDERAEAEALYRLIRERGGTSG